MKYEVAIIYKGQSNFIVEADSPKEAREKAERRFKEGDTPDHTGGEWEEIDHICEPATIDEA